ncbi:MAG: dipeptidase [Candidatus Lokiarchaeia archaeon]
MNERSDLTNKILESIIIVDTLSHGPLVWSDSLVAASNDMLALGLSPWKIVQDLIVVAAKTIVEDDDYFEKYVDAWRESGVTCVSWTLGPIYEKPYSFDGVFHNYSFLAHILDNRRDFLVKVLKAEDVEKAFKEGKKGVILNFQSLEHIGNNPDLLDLYYMMGFRIMQLTYNYRNLIGNGCTERGDGGLSNFGLTVIDRINQLGALVDVSHCGPQTSMDAAENSKDPVLATHTFSKKLYEHDRGKTDELLNAIAEKGGYIGVLAVPGFLTSKPKTTIDDWLDHVDYIVNLVGVDHVGIGTDFYGFSLPEPLAVKISEFLEVLGFRPEHRASFAQKVEGFENYVKFPNLIEGLVTRGYSEQEIKKIAGENFLRVFRKVVG